MEHKELMSYKRKPPFYENHKKIIDSTLMEPTQMALYLHENMLSHYNDIEDVADCLDVYSTVEGPKDCLDYEQIGWSAFHDLAYTTSLLESMAITEFNEHSSTKDRKMLTVTVPQIYECKRNSKLAREMIRDGLKTGQIYQGKPWSPDIMIQSTTQTVRDAYSYLGKLNLLNDELK